MYEIIEKYELLVEKIIGEPITVHVNNIHCPWNDKLSVPPPTGKYVIKTTSGKSVASFELFPMINCCGICVSTRAEVNINYRKRGLGIIFNSLRIDIARALDYGILMCTDVESNIAQRKILDKNGWEDIFKFVNPRTNRTVFISVILLNKILKENE
jgi:hypothetical protein